MSVQDIHIWEQVYDIHRAEFVQKVNRLIDRHEEVLLCAAFESAAWIADQVEATARPGEAKETAGEIGQRIRALRDHRR